MRRRSHGPRPEKRFYRESRYIVRVPRGGLCEYIRMYGAARWNGSELLLQVAKPVNVVSCYASARAVCAVLVHMYGRKYGIPHLSQRSFFARRSAPEGGSIPDAIPTGRSRIQERTGESCDCYLLVLTSTCVRQFSARWENAHRQNIFGDLGEVGHPSASPDPCKFYFGPPASSQVQTPRTRQSRRVHPPGAGFSLP